MADFYGTCDNCGDAYDQMGFCSCDSQDEAAAVEEEKVRELWEQHGEDNDFDNADTMEHDWYGEAMMAQYDDDPSPYDGNYSEM